MGRRKRIVGMAAGIFVALTFCAGCAADRGQSAGDIERQRTAGIEAANTDWCCGDGGIYVFRLVAPGETDPATGLPVRDAGTDAVSPAWAAWVTAYNAAIRKHRAEERSAATTRRTARLPWNERYGICVATAGADGEVIAAKVFEYLQDGSKKQVPQTASRTEGGVAIIFDEYKGEMIGLAEYEVSRSLIHRDGDIFAVVAGREVKLGSNTERD
jgi:hypothetical protein